MNVYVQVLSHAQNKEVLKLLMFPNAFRDVEFKAQARVSGGGELVEYERDVIRNLCEKLGENKFNQAEVTYGIDGGDAALPGVLESLTGLLTPSASSSVWFRSKDWVRGGDRDHRTRRLNTKAAETGLAYYGIQCAPSVLECVFELSSTGTVEEVLSAFAGRLCLSIPKPLEPLNIFGCVDVGGDDYFVELEAKVLMTRQIRIMANLFPPVYPKLGNRFDKLHPLLFGPAKTCQGIKSALGNDATLLKNCAASDFGVIWLKATCNLVAASTKASQWLLLDEPSEA
jgi:hypothetical protein